MLGVTLTLQQGGQGQESVYCRSLLQEDLLHTFIAQRNSSFLENKNDKWWKTKEKAESKKLGEDETELLWHCHGVREEGGEGGQQQGRGEEEEKHVGLPG